MARGKKHTPEQIVSLLRQIEVGVANGKTTVAACRLACWQGPGRAHLAPRRAESSTEAKATRAAVAQRRIVRSASAAARQPCLEL